METLIQQIINGLVLGSMYALVALGYTMVYGIINLINFAHGEILMVGAMVSWTIVTALAGSGLPGWLLMLIGLACAIVVCAVLNFSVEKIAYRPLRNAPRLAPADHGDGHVAAAAGDRDDHLEAQPQALPAAAAHHALRSRRAGDHGHAVPDPGPDRRHPRGADDLVNYTKLGRAMRATAENPRVAGLMGVKPDFIISTTFVIGAALAAVAGLMWAANYGTVQHTMGFMPGLKAFTAAVLGGIGNLAGAVVGGLLLGLIEAIGAGYLGDLTGGVLGSHYADIFAFIALILVLTLRPSGLLGERVADRA